MKCRSCDSINTQSILSLGKLPLANRLLTSEQLKENEPKYPLEIMMCLACSLVQLSETINPKALFDDYFYFSSHSDTMIRSAANLVSKIKMTLPVNACVIEIASNDGYLLQHYLSQNYRVLGIEPAKNVADLALKKEIPTCCDYFSLSLAKKLCADGFHADIIHANNVMAHVPTINDFVLGIKTLLKPEGKAYIEVPYLLNLINHCEFDTIYHEHVFYFTVTSLQAIFSKHQLTINHIEEIAIHGGSLRLTVGHEKGFKTPLLEQYLNHEKNLQLDRIEYYQSFGQRIYDLKDKLLSLLLSIKKKGQSISGYGAAAKGSTLMNFFGIGKEYLDFIVDRSRFKQGHFMSGNHLPIYAPHCLIEKKIHYALLFTWNFAEEILKQQQPYRNQGGQFIIPIPTVRVI